MSDRIDVPADSPADRFWTFSVAVYGAPEVAAACLGLQDGCGLDVNLLLFCCWSAAEGAPALGDVKIAEAVAAIRSWRERAIAPLRAIRRDLKNPVDGIDPPTREAFRKRVAALELEAERVTQRLLVAAVPCSVDIRATVAERLAAGAANVVGYAVAAGIDPVDQRAGLSTLLGAALGVSPATADQATEQAIRSRAVASAAL